jgi:hypothetical protein
MQQGNENIGEILKRLWDIWSKAGNNTDVTISAKDLQSILKMAEHGVTMTANNVDAIRLMKDAKRRTDQLQADLRKTEAYCWAMLRERGPFTFEIEKMESKFVLLQKVDVENKTVDISAHLPEDIEELKQQGAFEGARVEFEKRASKSPFE